MGLYKFQEGVYYYFMVLQIELVWNYFCCYSGFGGIGIQWVVDYDIVKYYIVYRIDFRLIVVQL